MMSKEDVTDCCCCYCCCCCWCCWWWWWMVITNTYSIRYKTGLWVFLLLFLLVLLGYCFCCCCGCCCWFKFKELIYFVSELLSKIVAIDVIYCSSLPSLTYSIIWYHHKYSCTHLLSLLLLLLPRKSLFYSIFIVITNFK